MEEVKHLIEPSIDRAEKELTTTSAVSDPIVIETNTTIPLMSVGIGFVVPTSRDSLRMTQ